ncbi:hypothetical protein VCB98_09615 [Gammaproteobacteria bacterium AB-CW1]|uniref:Uncharacterized protein n=1 Tax=Natronospira elongata TaxID=3110268 RepID=A0AAP6JG80_9GAMM|nr:hypothetical protein [Gammaproteobacteria bacterium AB-CW1]
MNLLYSSDSDCDWLNYTLCDDGGMMPDETGGSLVLRADDGFDPDTGWFFVIESDATLSYPAGARPVPLAATKYDRVTGRVFDAAVDADRIYLGGDFSRLGPLTGPGAAVHMDSGRLAGAVPYIDGPSVFAVAADGEGGFYIGGRFESVGGVPRRNLARIDAQGRVDRGWRANTDEAVTGIAVHEDRVFVSGLFGNLSRDGDSFEREGLALVSAVDGAVDPDWNPGSEGTVWTLATDGERVYVGGSFASVGGDSGVALAALDAQTGELIPDWGETPDNVVVTVHVADGVVYVGGYFETLGGEAANGVMALNPETGERLWDHNPAVDGLVMAVSADGERLYLGGDFESVGGLTRDNLAAVDRNTGAVVAGWETSADGAVWGVGVHGGWLYAAGNFRQAGGVERELLAAFDLTDGELNADWNPGASGHFTAGTMAFSGDVGFFGGRLQEITGHDRRYLAALDRETGQVLEDWRADQPTHLSRLLLDEGTLYASGDFPFEAGEPDWGYLTALNAETGEKSPSWDPPEIVGRTVRALAVDDERLYFGGRLSEVDGEARHNIAAVNRYNGALVSGWAPNVSSQVSAIAKKGDRLYIGGRFREVNEEDKLRLAALHRVSGELDKSFEFNAASNVSVLGLFGDSLLIGGQFRSINEVERERLAIIDLEENSLLEMGEIGVSDAVSSIAFDGSRLIVSGAFQQSGDTPRRRLAAFDLDSKTLISDWQPETDLVATLLSPIDGKLFISGSFQEVTGSSDDRHRPRLGFAVLDLESGDVAR